MRFWTLRVCAVLLGAYGLAWAYVAWVGYLGLTTTVSPTGPWNASAAAAGQVYTAFLLALGIAMAPTLLVLAVFVWLGSRVAVAVTVLPTIVVSAPMLIVLAGEVLQVAVYHHSIDWNITLWSLGLLIAGPGVVLALLFNPIGLRIWATPHHTSG